jgi:hypothetical protein
MNSSLYILSRSELLVALTGTRNLTVDHIEPPGYMESSTSKSTELRVSTHTILAVLNARSARMLIVEARMEVEF